MTVFTTVFRTLVKLLNTKFGHIDTSPQAPHEEVLQDYEKALQNGEKLKVEPTVEVPVCSGKMTFSAQDRPNEIAVRLLLSEEATVAGILDDANEWADKAEKELKRLFPKLVKPIRILVIEEDSQKTMHVRKTIFIRKNP